MTAGAARTPSLLLVLLPGFVLALLGVQAVLAELSSAETEARDRATAAAARLARSIERTVAEFESALPPEGARLSPLGAVVAVEHLLPRWVVGLDGRELGREAPPPAPTDPAAEALVRDVLERAAREATEPDGREIAAAICRAGAAAIESGAIRAQLLLEAGLHEIQAGRGEAALDTLEEALAVGRGSRTASGDMLEPRIAAAALDALAAVSDVPPPPWLQLLWREVAVDPWGMDDTLRASVLARAEVLADDDLAGAIATERALRDEIRADARALAAGGVLEGVTLRGTTDRLVVRLQREVTIETAGVDERAVVGGDVPAETVSGRLVAEAEALVAGGGNSERGVAAVDLLTPEGASAIRARRDGQEPARAARGEVALAPPFGGWRVQAAVAVPEGLPPFALLLAVACATMTLALALGALSLRRAAVRHAQLAEDRRTFLDHVAHEIRTPAASLLALSEELRGGGVPESERGEYEEQMVHEARRLAALIEDTLDVSRLDVGRLVYHTTPGDLREVVGEAIDVALARTGAVPTAVRRILPDDPVIVSVDASSLRRAVASLVDNAIRHGRPTSPVRVTLARADGGARIDVEDKGEGIAAADVERVFERFYRTQSATHEAKGVGLGLSLCREIVRGHGGEVHVASTPGRGTTVNVYLPLAPEDRGE